MDVATQRNLCVVFLQENEDGEPIVDAIIDRIMGNKNYRLVRVWKIIQGCFEPADILRSPMSVGHFHDRTFVKADKAKAAEIENKTIFLPKPGKIGRAGFGPFGVVIAGNDMT